MLGHIDVSGRILFILTMSDTLSFEGEATLDKATFSFLFLFFGEGWYDCDANRINKIRSFI